MSPARAADEPAARRARRVALGYAAFAALWILGSDWLLSVLVADEGWRMQASALKGWAFVGVTAVLLYALLRGGAQVSPATPAAPADTAPLPVRGLLVACAVVLLLAGLAVRHQAGQLERDTAAQLEATVLQRAQAAAAWRVARLQQASFLRDAPNWPDMLQRWRQQGENAALVRLQRRLDELQRSFELDAAAVVDAGGRVLAGSAALAVGPGRLAEALQRALATGSVEHGPLEGQPALPGRSHLDVVVPLLGSGEAPATYALVMRSDATPALLEAPATLPGALRGTTVALLQRGADGLLAADGSRPPALADPALLAARVLRGEAAAGAATPGSGLGGQPVLGAVQSVPGTDWLVVAEVDRGALARLALSRGAWVVAAGLLAVLGLVAGAVLLRDRRALAGVQAARQAQDERLRALALVQAIADASDDAIFAKDTEGRYLLCNRAAAALAGRSLPEILGRDDRTLFGDEVGRVVAANDRLVMREQRIVTAQQRVPLLTGTRVFFATKGPLRDEHGQLIGLFGISRDVTERAEQQAELDRHRHRLQELVDERTQQLQALNATLADRERFMRTVADGQPGQLSYWDRGLRCRFANRAFREWLGRGEAEVIGHDAATLLGDERWAGFADVVPAVLDGHRITLQRRHPHPDGRERHGLATFLPDRVDGEVRGFLVLVSDITELKEAELQLQQANEALMLSRDRAEQANRAKSAFLANMSHEIRTPMNAIVGLTHLLRRDARDAQQVERLGKVAEAASHLLQVLNDILDLSKIEAGKLELESTDFSLAEVLGHARALVAERAQAKGLALEVSARGVPDALHGDPTRLTQALLNLLSNAVKFTEHGEVQVVVGPDAAAAPQAGSVPLRFDVLDTGIGVPADKVGTLFSAFTQADTSTTRRFGGTGLGLAITQRLARQMGGEAGAEPRPGGGSRFWFSARLAPARGTPRRADAGAPAQAEGALRRAAAGRRVLLVEDHPVNQDVALELLRSAGLEAEVASDGAQALAAVQRQLPDLVLMDVQMPVMDGLEATRRLRALPLPVRVPVVAMTANAFGEDRAACLAAGMDDHLSKPVDPQALYQVLLRWLPAAAPVRPADPGADTLPPVAGLDLERALRHVGGRAAVLRRVLRQFADHYRPGLALPEAPADGAARRALGRSAHSVKGAAAAIGAVQVPALAEALEHTLDAQAPDADVQRAAQALQHELRRLVGALDVALGSAEPAAAAPPASAAEVEQLAALVEAGDFDATTLFRTLRPALAAAAPAACAQLERALAGFDFEAAAEALRALRSERHATAGA